MDLLFDLASATRSITSAHFAHSFAQERNPSSLFSILCALFACLPQAGKNMGGTL